MSRNRAWVAGALLLATATAGATVWLPPVQLMPIRHDTDSASSVWRAGPQPLRVDSATDFTSPSFDVTLYRAGQSTTTQLHFRCDAPLQWWKSNPAWVPVVGHGCVRDAFGKVVVKDVQLTLGLSTMELPGEPTERDGRFVVPCPAAMHAQSFEWIVNPAADGKDRVSVLGSDRRWAVEISVGPEWVNVLGVKRASGWLGNLVAMLAAEGGLATETGQCSPTFLECMDGAASACAPLCVASIRYTCNYPAVECSFSCGPCGGGD